MANIRYDIPDGLHWDLKRRAVDERMSLKDLVTKALQYYLDHNPPPRTLFDEEAKKQSKTGGG